MNSIYTLVYYQSDKALKALEKLSGLLRYTLYEQNERVLLQREIQYLHDFIDLERFRHDKELAVELKLGAGLDQLKIAPFLLLPFLENAFKHGELKNQKVPISIHLYKTADFLIFAIKNNLIQKEKDHQGGIGLENVIRRLELLYPEQHHLSLQNDGTTFSVTLKIKLDQC